MLPVQGIMLEGSPGAEKLEKILKAYVQAKEKDAGVRRTKKIRTHPYRTHSLIPTPLVPPSLRCCKLC